MPQFCAAFGCSNSTSKQICKGKKISFHNFPLTNKDLMQRWLHNLKRKNFVPSRYSKLCSEHFEEDCFEFQNFTHRRLIKKDAVPTKFCFSPSSYKRKRTSYTVGNVTETQDNESKEENVQSTSTVTTQTEVGFGNLIDELNMKNQEIATLKSEIKNNFSPTKMTDSELKTFTGFNKENFFKIYNFLNLEEDLDEELQKKKLPPIKKYFLFMMKLKTGVTMEFLAYIFKVSQVTVSRIFSFVASVIYDKVKVVPIWPDREQIDEYKPPEFKKKYPQCRVIIDCLEFEIQKPFNPLHQQMTFSHYKNRNTAKGLIGIAPSGGITFISELWTGSVSDKLLFKNSNLLQLLEPGDLVLADKGFRIAEELKNVYCQLGQPLFLTDKIQFSLEERAENKSISHLRVHVERAISRIKNFKYFEGQIPYNSFHNLNKDFYIAAFLTNFSPPLISFSPVLPESSDDKKDS